MEEKYCLKSEYDIFRVGRVEKELLDRGIQPKYRGEARSYDGEYESSFVINDRAFYIVCDMLSKKREESYKHEKKEYVFLRRSRWMSVIIVTLVISLCFIVPYSAKSNNETESLKTSVSQLNDKLIEAEKENIALKSKLNASEDRENTLSRKLDRIEDEYEFYHEVAVIVTTTGEKYHRYGCYHIRYPIWIYNIEAAESRGYEPCLDCIGG